MTNGMLTMKQHSQSKAAHAYEPWSRVTEKSQAYQTCSRSMQYFAGRLIAVLSSGKYSFAEQETGMQVQDMPSTQVPA